MIAGGSNLEFTLDDNTSLLVSIVDVTTKHFSRNSGFVVGQHSASIQENTIPGVQHGEIQLLSTKLSKAVDTLLVGMTNPVPPNLNEGTYYDVNLKTVTSSSGSAGGAKATVIVSASGEVTSITLTEGGIGYAVGDELYIDSSVWFGSGSSRVYFKVHLQHMANGLTLNDLTNLPSSGGSDSSNTSSIGSKLASAPDIDGTVVIETIKSNAQILNISFSLNQIIQYG